MKGTALLLLALVASVGLSSGIPISKNIIPDVEKKLHDTFVEWKSEVSARDVRDDEEASSSPYGLWAKWRESPPRRLLARICHTFVEYACSLQRWLVARAGTCP